jgi:release factor glutamine methyltransferase
MIYQPREDSYLLEKEVIKFAKGKRVIDIGTGSGIQALAAKRGGAKSVIACDINPEAVRFVLEKGIEALESDLFSKITDKFDLIVFNPPYLPEDDREDEESRLITSGGKRGDEIILRFIKQARDHLNRGGKILLLISNLTPQKEIVSLINKLGLNYRILEENKFDFERLEVWLIEFSERSAL